MSPASRLRLDPSTHLPSIHSFGELGQFLRGSIADEESRQVSESMAQLATQTEAIVSALRLTRARATIAPLLVDLLDILRAHRHMVVGLGMHWRGLHEYAAYLQALNHFRVLVGQWLLDGGPRSQVLLLEAPDFELVAWRTLGEGLLLIDIYEQWVVTERDDHDSSLDAMDEPKVERAMQWWKKLRR